MMASSKPSPTIMNFDASFSIHFMVFAFIFKVFNEPILTLRVSLPNSLHRHLLILSSMLLAIFFKRMSWVTIFLLLLQFMAYFDIRFKEACVKELSLVLVIRDYLLCDSFV